MQLISLRGGGEEETEGGRHIKKEAKMLYDLGAMNMTGKLGRYLAVFGTLIIAGLIGCIIVAIMVRIGNLIIGW